MQRVACRMRYRLNSSTKWLLLICTQSAFVNHLLWLATLHLTLGPRLLPEDGGYFFLPYIGGWTSLQVDHLRWLKFWWFKTSGMKTLNGLIDNCGAMRGCALPQSYLSRDLFGMPHQNTLLLGNEVLGNSTRARCHGGNICTSWFFDRIHTSVPLGAYF